MKILVLLTLFFPAAVWGRSSGPWQVMIVYARPDQKRILHRTSRPSRPPPGRPKAKSKPDAAAMPKWWSLPRNPNAPVFISGSAEKPGVDDYKEWLRTRKPPQPDPRRKMIEEGRAAREFLLDVLQDETE